MLAKRPPESLANFRWVGPVPDELKDLTWIEEGVIAIFGGYCSRWGLLQIPGVIANAWVVADRGLSLTSNVIAVIGGYC